MSTEISIIIPAYNCKADLDRLLPSLRKTKHISYETIVVDDCSTDGTGDHCRSYDWVRVLRLPKNGGPARARNRGAEEAKGEIFIFIDADVMLPDDVDIVSEIAEIFRKRPAVDCVSTVTHIKPIVESAIAYNNSVYHAYYIDKLLSGQAVREGRFMFFSSRLGAMRKEKFRACGGFHESLHTVMNEDGELWTRCYHRGYVSRIEKRLYHYHRYPSDFRRFGKSYFLTAYVQALIDRLWDTSPDTTISSSEKWRRIYALALALWPLALLVMPLLSWLTVATCGLVLLPVVLGRISILAWRSVPTRFLPQWYLVYVAVSPVIFAGYAWGVFRHFTGNSLLRGNPSTAAFFGSTV